MIPKSIHPQRHTFKCTQGSLPTQGHAFKDAVRQIENSVGKDGHTRTKRLKTMTLLFAIIIE